MRYIYSIIQDVTHDESMYPLEDAIELINITSVPVDISCWWISDSKNELKNIVSRPGL